MNDLDMKNPGSATILNSCSKGAWQWRPKKWIRALIIMAIVLVAGSIIIRFLPEKYKGESDLIYNFNVVVMLVFAGWTVIYERGWAIWKRIFWILGLWFAHGFMQLILPKIIITPIDLLINSASLASIILIFFTMRRSTIFVEPASPDAKESWLSIW